jgi:acyl dehydratase
MSTEGRYFEELEVGESVDCGRVEVTEREMLEFAERYDPQPFHVDSDAAAKTMFGELVASGWLTCSLTARLLVTGYMNENATLGGDGIDDLRWHRPVHAGDVLHVEAELVAKHAGEHPRFGRTEVAVTTTNDAGETVLTMTGLGLVARRGTAAGEDG